MQIKVLSNDAELTHVRASGKITPDSFSGGSEPLAKMLGESVYARPLLMSFEGADYINSSGVGWLLICHKRCRESGGKLVLFAIPKMIQNVFNVLKMDRVFCLVESYDDAVAAARQAPS
jgi:anti-anti-sigma factor